jgi:hypothetical protein
MLIISSGEVDHVQFQSIECLVLWLGPAVLVYLVLSVPCIYLALTLMEHLQVRDIYASSTLGTGVQS